ncbi:MAG: hypothetical protein HRT89_09575 [Lentisphaeria bacterium]|nr:hypothetical protein [Lentisphaeria bacterium]NQZ68310.1 hypothetical protein [Lentisphaeria bacterium]
MLRKCVISPCLVLFFVACTTPPQLTVSEKELKRFPLELELPGNPARSGLRYWAKPFKPIPAYGAYVSVIYRDNQYELWRGSLVLGNTHTKGKLGKLYHTATPKQKVNIVSRGPTMQTLGNDEPRFNASLVDDLFLPNKPDELAPGRGFTRTCMTWFKDIGYVFYCCTTRGYSPGQVSLYPAFFTSKTGKLGTWTYQGKMKGEPLEIAKKKVVWSDGGSLHRLADGRWRAYLNGFGQVATAVEAKSITGKWSFIRNAKGEIKELLPDFPKTAKRGGCWIHVLQVHEKEWHLWLSDTWPAQSIWHYSSTDGLSWKPYGKQPEITRIAVGGRAIKCFRTYLHPNGKEIVGMLSVRGRIGSGPEGWVLHLSKIPTGLQP